MSCIFCKINNGEVPSEILYRDEDMFIIKDIDPKANKHYLMIPTKHYKLISDMTDEDAEAFARSIRKIPTLSKELGLENGYRLIINQGDDAGQTVFHLHVHILAGQPLDFPDLKKQ